MAIKAERILPPFCPVSPAAVKCPDPDLMKGSPKVSKMEVKSRRLQEVCDLRAASSDGRRNVRVVCPE